VVNWLGRHAVRAGIGSTGVGSYNLFNSTPITAIQASVTGLPTNGTTLYVRLYSMINGAWQYNDYIYTQPQRQCRQY